jgi:hypothetical protein
MPATTFETWQTTVDRYVTGSIGLSIHDLPDQPYYDWWEDYVSAKTAARRVVRAALNGEL